MAASGNAYPVGPFFRSRKTSPLAGDWQLPINDWLVELGRHVFEVVPFRLGLVGFEVSGKAYAGELFEEGVPK